MNETVKDKKARITQQSILLTALSGFCGVAIDCLPNPHTSRTAMIIDLAGTGVIFACLGWIGWRLFHAARELKALERAERAALAVDRERGWMDADGESVGLAESIAQLAIGLRYDIHGPQGRD